MEEQSSDIEVTVKTLDSQSRSYALTVKEFKEHIAPSVGIPVDKQRLIYQGRVLQDERTLADYVGGKVIHLVERAPPPPSQGGSGSGGTSADSGPSSSSQGTSQVPHDRNANSYVMLGTFNLPVNIMDPQQIQQSNGSVNVHIDMDQPVQSEPRLRLVLAENLLRDVQDVISRMEGRSTDSSSQTETPPPAAAAAPPPPSSSSTTSTPSPSAQPMDTSPPPTTPPPPSSAPSEGPTPQPGPPAELAEMLSELRRVEERLQPFMQRAHSILETATTAEYNNQEREDDQRTLVQICECLRLLGNALVALSDLRLNLMSPVPRHLHVVRPFSHYSSMNLGATVTVAANSTEGQAPPTQPTGQPEQANQGQSSPSPSTPSNQQAGQGPGGPRVIRISHQAVPVVMMQMNADPGALPPDFMRNVMQQISQYAAAVATSAAAATAQPSPPSSTPSAPPASSQSGSQQPQQARVVFSRPPFAAAAPPPVFGARGTTINVRAAVPGQQPGQALNQMISGLVGQLLVPGQMGQTVTTSSSSSSSSTSFSFSGSGPNPPPAASSQNQSEAGAAEPQPDLAPDLRQLLGSLLGEAGGPAAGSGPSGAPSITVTSSGVPAFIQGVTDFMQQPIFSPPPQASGPTAGPGPAGAAESLNPELFTGILRGVLNSMMGSLGQNQNDTESIAQFMQRLSQTTNIFFSPEDPTFFGELLMLVCQTFTMSDLVMLLHGQHQPLSRIQPQLAQFFTQNFLSGREPTDQNIALQGAADGLVTELQEYISESFSNVSVLDGVDVTQTNMSFFRQQLTQIATHILRCSETFGPRLLQMCNQALFECLALNLHCLRGDQRALTAVINHRIVLSPAAATTAEEAMSHDNAAASSRETRALPGDLGASGGAAPLGGDMVAAGAEGGSEESESWAAAVPPEWVPIIRRDMMTQRKMKAQPPLSDAYLHGMPAKRRKTGQGGGSLLSLSDAVSQAARNMGVRPITSPEQLQADLETQEVKEAYSEQVKADVKKRVRDDPEFNPQQFPNAHRAFAPDS
uniref:BCL2-associated athanogene 6 n=1 Tax=Cyprinodon variegatus TaxID=28743 RepID=A0A3Q2CXS7_CYPVA